MDFRILDASAFYAGVPFRSSEDCYTTSLVYDEIQHIKKNQDVLGTLLETNRLKIREPDKQSTQAAIKAAKETVMMVVDPSTGQKAKFTSKNTIIEVFKKKNVIDGKVLYSNSDRMDINNILKFY